MQDRAKKINQPRVSAKISPTLNKTLAAYMAAGAAAGVGLMTAAQQAEAKVIYTPTYAKVTDLYYLDLNHDGIRDFVLWNVASCTSTACGGELMAYLSGGPNVVAGILSQASALRAGAVIGPAVQFPAVSEMMMVSGGIHHRQGSSSQPPAEWFGQFANGGKGVRDRYLGLKFTINGQTHYGWARFSVSIPNAKILNFTPILTGYAYETEPNKPIVAGQETSAATIGSLLPEPLDVTTQTLGMLAHGYDAISNWRRENGAAAQ